LYRIEYLRDAHALTLTNPGIRVKPSLIHAFGSRGKFFRRTERGCGNLSLRMLATAILCSCFNLASAVACDRHTRLLRPARAAAP
jgi:hypothetical protein